MELPTVDQARIQVVNDSTDFAKFNNQGNSNLSKDALGAAKILGYAAQQSSTTTGIRNHLPNHLKGECRESVLRCIAYVEEACHHPRLSSGTTTSRTLDDEFIMSPLNYAKSMVMLARDMDAQPWGAFAFHAPSLYLPFLQQLATDLMD